MRAMRHRLELYSARIGSPDLARSILPLRSASACFLGLEPGALSVGGRVGMRPIGAHQKRTCRRYLRG
jgi:hypothetical protein